MQAIRAIRRADTIVIGPGDLYTSLIPNLLVPDIAKAVRESDAEKVYICNLMTKHGETDGFQGLRFCLEIHRYLGGRVDRVIVNDGPFPPDVVKMYAEQRAYWRKQTTRDSHTSLPLSPLGILTWKTIGLLVTTPNGWYERSSL